MKDLYTSKIFLNVYALTPCLILNNKLRSHPGEHLLALYFDESQREFFLREISIQW